MDVREKLAFSVCNATQKTNYKCDFKCDKKGKCAYCLVMAEQMIAHGVTVQEWISVKDRLPDTQEYDWVLVNIRLMPEDYDGVPCVAFLRNGNWYDDQVGLLDTSEAGCGVIVTHWMPLPEPPKEADA